MNPTSNRKVWVLSLSAGALLIGAAYVAYLQFFPNGFSSSGNTDPASDSILGTAWRNADKFRYDGDYQTALNLRRAAAQDTKLTKEQKAIVEIMTAGSQFHVTGNIDDRIRDIETLKNIALDKDFSLDTRVAAINSVASGYDDSGSDPKVFAAMYEGEPWGKFAVPNDPWRSARNLYLYSYSIKPTAISAVRIANSYALEWVYYRDELSTTTMQQNTAHVIEYLKAADQLAADEATKSTNYDRGNRYANYRTWKADTIIVLWRQPGGESYKDLYRKESESYIEYAKSKKNVLATENLFFVRWEYATALNAEKDYAAAKTQLDTLAEELNALPNPDTIGFVRKIRSVYTYSPDGSTVRRLAILRKISSNFDAAIKKLLDTAPPPSVASTTIRDGR